MSFRVTMYKFSKRSNSTLRPSGGRSFQCTIKAGSGVLYPTINLDLGGAAQYPDYNYAYIPDFDRYYYIQDMINRGPIWEIKLKVDPLASWRDTIGSTSLYILRSSAEMDGNVYDTYYPATAGCSISKQTASSPWSGGSTADISGGVFIVGVVSKNAEVGCIAYKAMGSSMFSNMCTKLLDDTIVAPDYTTQDASLALQKSLIDPLSYVRSCVWLPIGEAEIPGQSEITMRVWDWNISPVAHTNVPMSSGYITKSLSFTIPKHPQQSRGNYLNLSPYSTYWISVPPFGIIEIDSTAISAVSTINAVIYLDYVTGLGTLEISAGGNLLNKIETQIGVTVSMSQVTKDYLGAGSTAVSSIANTIQNAVFGNYAGAVTAAASGIDSAAKALAPKVQTTGSTGSFSRIHGDPAFYGQFFTIADEDLSHNGRPLCKVRTPSALGGFMMVLDGDVPAPATDQELSEIRSYLEGGFYWE